jgi:hypothetical protein
MLNYNMSANNNSHPSESFGVILRDKGSLAHSKGTIQ